MKFNLNPICMPGHRLVHRIVHDLSGQMMISPLVNSPDIHPRPKPHRLQRFKHLNRGRVINILAAGKQVIRHGMLDS